MAAESTLGKGFSPSHPKPLNGSQFSQLSLFHAEPTEEHRWPAGYTPERKAEVAEAIPTSKVSSMDVQDSGGAFKGWNDIESVQMLRRGLSIDPSETYRAQRAQHHAALTDAVARSSIPSEDLKSVPSISVTPMSSGIGGDYSSYLVHDPADNPVSRALASDKNRIRINASSTKQNAQTSLVHELGHHADYMEDPHGFGAVSELERDEGSGASPTLEGAAEGYRFRHVGTRRGQEPEDYAKTGSYQGMRSDPRFAERFEAVSGMSLEQATAQPPQHIGPQFSGQGRLFERNVSTHEAGMTLDYGQHPLETSWRGAEWGARPGEYHDLDTIRMGSGPPSPDVPAPGFQAGDAQRIHRHAQRVMQTSKAIDPESSEPASVQFREHKRVQKAWNTRFPNENPIGDFVPPRM